MACCAACGGRGLGHCERVARLGALGQVQHDKWWRVTSGLYGAVGWFYGTDDDAVRIERRPQSITEWPGVPFPGRFATIPEQNRYWEVWDRVSGAFIGFFHGTSKGALQISLGNFDLHLPQGAAELADAPAPPPGAMQENAHERFLAGLAIAAAAIGLGVLAERRMR